MPAKGPAGSARSAGASRPWTTLAGLRSLSATAWDRGQLLREALEPTDVYPRRRALKRPSAAELRDDYAAAREWAAELFASMRTYTLETVDVGRTTIGSNRLPAAAVFARVEDEIAFVGKTRELGQFRSLTERLTGLDPSLSAWAMKRPLQLLALGDAALTAAHVALWLRENPGPRIYLRQLSLPGVHTKFIETHRRVIDEVVAVLQQEPPEVDLADQDSALDEEESALLNPIARTPAARFAERHGFLHPPELVRFRLLDPAIPLLGDARDVMVTAKAFSTLRLPITSVIVTENLVNFLALPDRPRSLALFGAGYGFSALRDAEWLRDCEVLYWGDLDTHGFRILDQLRSVHPHVSSVLMDEATLLAHREAWSVEASPSRAQLARLTTEEAEVYESLGNNRYGSGVRLEQELIRWNWALERIAAGSV
ncbi:Wadjet anti-phage system protein JetD domain-containing protein [Arthrobacter sp. efr-133-TYG-118]|uniref:Wadjet anti-phage system protein JetD domain-containing protein n=1 Tax=Arthrobacter sp. efr-133-TYG-118 TaxID=3040279 RepID=UPI00254C872D|nr:Wadjet anti-phage system protein JetD domain-containing protein [Arthrobacter sp. efr-133-TYG-118]